MQLCGIVYLKERKAVSPIIGSLIMLAVVAVVGSLILLQGLQGITTFTASVDFLNVEENTSVQENLIIEHVRFDPDSTDVSVWVRNVGTNEATISKITMVKIDSQDLIISDDSFGETVFFKSVSEFTPTVISLPVDVGEDQKWSSDDANGKPLKDAKYRITVATAHGNLFDSVVKPYNT